MAFDPNTFAQNPMLAAIMARTVGGASGMPVPQEAMPGGGAIEGTIQQTAEQEVDLPKLIGERLDLKMAPPSSRGGVLAGGLAIALQNAWNTRVKNRDIELERKLQDISDKKKMEAFKAELKERRESEMAVKEAMAKEREGSEEYQLDLEGKRLRNEAYRQNMARRVAGGGGGGGQAQPSIAPTAESMTGEQLDMLLKANGITRAQWELMNPKQQQQMIPKLVGRNKRSKSDIIRDLSNLPDISLNPYVEVRKKELEAELAESEGQPTGGSETSGSRANSFDAQTAAHLSKARQNTAAPVTQNSVPQPTTPAAPTFRSYTPQAATILDPTKAAYMEKLPALSQNLGSTESPKLNIEYIARKELINVAKKGGFYTPDMENMGIEEIKAVMSRGR